MDHGITKDIPALPRGRRRAAPHRLGRAGRGGAHPENQRALPARGADGDILRVRRAAHRPAGGSPEGRPAVRRRDPRAGARRRDAGAVAARALPDQPHSAANGELRVPRGALRAAVRAGSGAARGRRHVPPPGVQRRQGVGVVLPGVGVDDGLSEIAEWAPLEEGVGENEAEVELLRRKLDRKRLVTSTGWKSALSAQVFRHGFGILEADRETLETYGRWRIKRFYDTLCELLLTSPP